MMCMGSGQFTHTHERAHIGNCKSGGLFRHGSQISRKCHRGVGNFRKFPEISISVEIPGNSRPETHTRWHRLTGGTHAGQYQSSQGIVQRRLVGYIELSLCFLFVAIGGLVCDMWWSNQLIAPMNC